MILEQILFVMHELTHGYTAGLLKAAPVETTKQ